MISTISSSIPRLWNLHSIDVKKNDQATKWSDWISALLRKFCSSSVQNSLDYEQFWDLTNSISQLFESLVKWNKVNT